jgi:CheY-like chemotaxis protein
MLRQTSLVRHISIMDGSTHMPPMTDPTSALQSSVAIDNPTLLIVDDSRLMRHALRKILKDDFNLVEAADGEEAWEMLRAEPTIQAIFSDLSMPNLDGYGLLERVRNSGEARISCLPFIVITGKEGEYASLREEAQIRGANDVVCKPFKSEEIIGMTKTFLSPDTQSDVEVSAQFQAEETARLAAEQEAHRVAEEAAAQRQAEETARLATEHEARRVAEEVAAQRQVEETARLAAEHEARRVAEEAAAQRQVEETARLTAEQEARRVAEEAAAQRQAEETARVAAEQEARRVAEEAAAQQPSPTDNGSQHSSEEDAKTVTYVEQRDELDYTAHPAAAEPPRFPPLTRLCIRLALPFMHIGNRLLRLKRDKQLSALRKRL